MTITDLTAVSGRLKGLRARLSLTQAEVAAESGIKPRTLWSWENAEAETTAENYDLLAGYYSEKLGEEITRDWILFGYAPEASARPLGGDGSELHEALGRLETEIQEFVVNRVDALRETLRIEILAELKADLLQGNFPSATTPRDQSTP